jgi:hypothetical protein
MRRFLHCPLIVDYEGQCDVNSRPVGADIFFIRHVVANLTDFIHLAKSGSQQLVTCIEFTGC